MTEVEKFIAEVCETLDKDGVEVDKKVKKALMKGIKANVYMLTQKPKAMSGYAAYSAEKGLFGSDAKEAWDGLTEAEKKKWNVKAKESTASRGEHCSYVISRGARKGEVCGKASEGDKCKTHTGVKGERKQSLYSKVNTMVRKLGGTTEEKKEKVSAIWESMKGGEKRVTEELEGKIDEAYTKYEEVKTEKEADLGFIGALIAPYMA